ncbi:MAG: F0F1 ATP synthase subunit epsilon [Firmicutes bacterium]|nr:F0F1 ATP synthase subunit epsilon [Bacillota bacterium]
MAEKTQRLDVITPERVVLSDEVRFLVAPGTEGELGILPEHAPLVTTLDIGIMRVHKENRTYRVVVTGGFMEVHRNRVVVLASAAERAEEIDVERARAAKERAERRLASRDPEVDLVRAEAALKRALTRLKAAEQVH